MLSQIVEHLFFQGCSCPSLEQLKLFRSRPETTCAISSYPVSFSFATRISQLEYHSARGLEVAHSWTSHLSGPAATSAIDLAGRLRSWHTSAANNRYLRTGCCFSTRLSNFPDILVGGEVVRLCIGIVQWGAADVLFDW